MNRTKCLLIIPVMLLFLVACSKKSEDNPESPQPAAPDSSAQATPPAAAPAAQPAPAPAPPAPPPPKPKPKPVVIPAGTVLTVRLQQALGSKTSNVGDRFDATLAEPVVVGGKAVAPAGSSASGTVTEAHPAGRFKGAATLGVALSGLTIAGHTYQIATVPASQTSTGKGKRTAGMVGGGAGGGALIGGLAGGGKGAAIGALVGAGAGTAGAAFTGNRDITLPAESAVGFQMTQALTLRPGSEN
jgi:hypothetical protein